ncbi:MAG: hypothetical protein Q7O66_00655, partial [Dehalococcoidia bacterium]|nr:hypothetical protein [Dehalococcoidia bacterium]
GFEKMTAYHSTKGAMLNARNPRLDELIDMVPQTADPAQKKKLALEAAVLAKNEYSLTGVLNIFTVLALGPKVGEITTVAGMATNAYNLATVTHPK